MVHQSRNERSKEEQLREKRCSRRHIWTRPEKSNLLHLLFLRTLQSPSGKDRIRVSKTHYATFPCVLHGGKFSIGPFCHSGVSVLVQIRDFLHPDTGSVELSQIDLFGLLVTPLTSESSPQVVQFVQIFSCRRNPG